MIVLLHAATRILDGATERSQSAIRERPDYFREFRRERSLRFANGRTV